MTEPPLIIGIDWGPDDLATALLLQVDGPRLIVIDEMTKVTKPMLDAIGMYEPVPLKGEDPGLIKKSGKMVKRHHPIPSTPRRFKPR